MRRHEELKQLLAKRADATVTNHSETNAATNVKLVFTLSSGTAYQSVSPASGTCCLSGLTLTCTLANLAANGTWQPGFTVNSESTYGMN